jgi:hypothetical protein
MGDEEYEGEESCERDCATNLERELMALMKQASAGLMVKEAGGMTGEGWPREHKVHLQLGDL